VKRCPGCGDEFRKGKIAFVLLPTGELERKRVCPECASTIAIRIVPVQAKGHANACKLCGASARFCEEHRTRAPELEVIKRKLVAFRMYATMTEIGEPISIERIAGKVESLEQAIGVVDAVLAGRPL
jgi:predicted RNA-binding Zn-ribbon protein involved in translation (DUF1610 family)